MAYANLPNLDDLTIKDRPDPRQEDERNDFSEIPQSYRLDISKEDQLIYGGTWKDDAVLGGEPVKFELFNPVGDGNCVFRAISYNYRAHENLHILFRIACLEHMIFQRSSGKLSHFTDQDLRCAATYDTPITDGCIQALAEWLKINIYMYCYTPRKKWRVFRSTESHIDVLVMAKPGSPELLNHMYYVDGKFEMNKVSNKEDTDFPEKEEKEVDVESLVEIMTRSITGSIHTKLKLFVNFTSCHEICNEGDEVSLHTLCSCFVTWLNHYMTQILQQRFVDYNIIEIMYKSSDNSQTATHAELECKSFVGHIDITNNILMDLYNISAHNQTLGNTFENEEAIYNDLTQLLEKIRSNVISVISKSINKKVKLFIDFTSSCNKMMCNEGDEARLQTLSSSFVYWLEHYKTLISQQHFNCYIEMMYKYCDSPQTATHAELHCESFERHINVIHNILTDLYNIGAHNEVLKDTFNTVNTIWKELSHLLERIRDEEKMEM